MECEAKGSILEKGQNRMKRIAQQFDGADSIQSRLIMVFGTKGDDHDTRLVLRIRFKSPRAAISLLHQSLL